MKETLMTDFNAINSALQAVEVTPTPEVNLQVVTLAGTKTLIIVSGSTVKQIKEDNEMEAVKFVTEDGIILTNTDIITSDMTVYISASKENGCGTLTAGTEVVSKKK